MAVMANSVTREGEHTETDMLGRNEPTNDRL